jgi:hypothetical protein
LPPGCAIVDLLIAHTGGQFGVGHGGVPCVIEHGGTTGSALPPPGAPLHVAATASDFSTPSHGSGTPPDRPSALRMHSDLLTQAAAAHAGVPGQLQLEFAEKPDAHEPDGVPYDANEMLEMTPPSAPQRSSSVSVPRAVATPQMGKAADAAATRRENVSSIFARP